MTKFKDNFFVIDSENLENAESKLYGYCITDTNVDGGGDNTLLKDETLYTKTYNGAFVAVQNFKDKVYISQDFVGSWGLYLFRSGDYWAVGNSFLFLVEYLKTRFALTPNVDYMKDFILRGLASGSVQETMVNEIDILPRNISLLIDKKERTLSVFKKEFKDETLELDSKEGIAALDAWFYTWTNFLKVLASKTDKIQIDLSGGMDTRLVLLLVLCAGVNLEKIRFHSIDDGLHTHGDDFAIASEIAKKYDFELNKEIKAERVPFSLGDTIGLSFYTKLGCHKEMYFKYNSSIEPIFAFDGNGGGMIRKYDFLSVQEVVEKFAARQDSFRMDYDFLSGTKNILNNAENILRENFRFDNETFAHCLYKHSRMRYHFGKACVEQYICNVIGISPLLDSNLHKIKIDSNNGDLILATILMRYKPELFDFKFDGGRTVEEKAFEAAKKNNEKYPFVDSEEKRAFYSNRNVIFDYKPFASAETVQNKEPIQITDCLPFSTQRNVIVYADPLEWCKKLFRSNFVKRNFCQLFPKRVYNRAEKYIHKHLYFPLAEAYAVIAIAKTVYDTNYSQGINRDDAFDFLNAMSELPEDGAGEEENPYTIAQMGAALEILRTGRLDIKLENSAIPNSDITLEIVSPKEKCKVTTPQWFAKNGIGYVVECSGYEMELRAKCKNDGVLKFFLRAKDVRYNGERIHVFIDYENLEINGKKMLEKITPFAHDKPFKYEMPVSEGDEIKIRLSWNAHKYADGEGEEILRKILER